MPHSLALELSMATFSAYQLHVAIYNRFCLAFCRQQWLGRNVLRAVRMPYYVDRTTDVSFIASPDFFIIIADFGRVIKNNFPSAHTIWRLKLELLLLALQTVWKNISLNLESSLFWFASIRFEISRSRSKSDDGLSTGIKHAIQWFRESYCCDSE